MDFAFLVISASLFFWMRKSFWSAQCFFWWETVVLSKHKLTKVPLLLVKNTLRVLLSKFFVWKIALLYQNELMLLPWCPKACLLPFSFRLSTAVILDLAVIWTLFSFSLLNLKPNGESSSCYLQKGQFRLKILLHFSTFLIINCLFFSLCWCCWSLS